MVNAETELQRSQALSQMEGALSSVYKEWRRSIIKCLANIEAYIDFGEDENVDDNILKESKSIYKTKTLQNFEHSFVCNTNKKPI